MTELVEKGSVVLGVEDPRSSLFRVIEGKHGKGQLQGYAFGNRILLIGLARVGAAVLGIDTVGIEELRNSITYMDTFPTIDHIFLWYLDMEGVRVEHLWSSSALP